VRLARALAGLLLFALLPNAIPAFGQTYGLTLAWDPSSSPDVTGYRVYYGTASGVYTASVPVGASASVTLPGLSSGVTYFFAVTAISAGGLESDFSNEISYQRAMTEARLQILGMTGGQLMLTVNGPVGHTYDIEATADLQKWTIIGTGTVGADGSVAFTDPNAGNYPQRFYRTVDPSSALLAARLQIQSVSGGQYKLTLTGPVGHTYDLEATADFKTWTVIGTGTIGVGGSWDLTDMNAPSYRQRFYRARDTQP
jgi:hypothetical protein